MVFQIAGQLNGLLRRGLEFVVEFDMWGPVEDQSIKHVIESVHKAQQADKHGDAKGHSDSGYERLAPPGYGESEGYAGQEFPFHEPGGMRTSFSVIPSRISALR